MRLGDGDSMVATNSSGGGISRMETGDGDRGCTVAVPVTGGGNDGG